MKKVNIEYEKSNLTLSRRLKPKKIRGALENRGEEERSLRLNLLREKSLRKNHLEKKNLHLK